MRPYAVKPCAAQLSVQGFFVYKFCMRNLVIGILIGTSLSLGLSAAASSKPTVTGGTGRLESVEVLGRDGEQICDEPYWYEDLKVISCE
jgi:hypothetical protein